MTAHGQWCRFSTPRAWRWGQQTEERNGMDQQVILHWQERRLGRTLLRTYRDTIDLYDAFPNDKQPRMGPKEDTELQRQIEANEGIFEPLLLEPYPDNRDKFRVIDGDRRWTNSKILVEVHKKEQYRRLPAEITDRTLTDEERFRAWIYIHRQRREWDTKEKEMVAYSLVNMVGRASAANIIGKINEQEITNSKDIRKLRQILKDPVARENFVSPGGNIDSALRTLGPAP